MFDKEFESEVQLDLARPRVIVLSDRGHEFVLSCRPITDADWTAYFAAIAVTSEQKGRERINVLDITTPRVRLAEAVLESVSGYKVAGTDELTSIENWQSKIPLAHRVKLGEVLSDVRPSPAADDFEISIDGEVVSLDATWSAIAVSPEQPVTMQRISGLKHILRTPTEDQYRRFQREASRAIVVGGSRAGKTIYPGANAMLAKLYDELIVRVEGYSWDGAPLTGTPAPGTMDMLHKVIAAQEVFQPQSTVELAGSVDE